MIIHYYYYSLLLLYFTLALGLTIELEREWHVLGSGKWTVARLTGEHFAAVMTSDVLHLQHLRHVTGPQLRHRPTAIGPQLAVHQPSQMRNRQTWFKLIHIKNYQYQNRKIAFFNSKKTGRNIHIFGMCFATFLKRKRWRILWNNFHICRTNRFPVISCLSWPQFWNRKNRPYSF